MILFFTSVNLTYERFACARFTYDPWAQGIFSAANHVRHNIRLSILVHIPIWWIFGAPQSYIWPTRSAANITKPWASHALIMPILSAWLYSHSYHVFLKCPGWLKYLHHLLMMIHDRLGKLQMYQQRMKIVLRVIESLGERIIPLCVMAHASSLPPCCCLGLVPSNCGRLLTFSLLMLVHAEGAQGWVVNDENPGTVFMWLILQYFGASMHVKNHIHLSLAYQNHSHRNIFLLCLQNLNTVSDKASILPQVGRSIICIAHSAKLDHSLGSEWPWQVCR